MAQQTINIGTVANDGTGDDLRVAMQKVNDNFTELYGASPVTAQITISGNQISSNATNANLKLTASGTGVVEFEGVNIRDNHIESNRSNDDLILGASGTGNVIVEGIRINGTTLSSDDSSVITVSDTLDAAGGLTVSNISSNDSSQVVVNDGLLVEGNTNLNGDVNISGTLTATTITGAVATTRGDISDGEATTASSSATSELDTTAISTYRSIRYDLSVSDSTNSRYALYSILITHDGSNAYISSSNVSSTGSDLGTFDADISGGNVRLLVTPATSDSMTYKFIKTALDV